MWDTLRNAWKVPELRKKILYTFMNDSYTHLTLQTKAKV